MQCQEQLGLNSCINYRYVNRKQPNLELTNSYFNSLYKNGKIYKVLFSDKKIYIGSTCEELNVRLNWHLRNKNSAVYKNKSKNPKIELIVNAPSNDRKRLENIEKKILKNMLKNMANY